MVQKNNVLYICIVLVIAAAIGVIIYLLVSCKNKNEPFCGGCQGIGNKVCTNRPLLHQLYNDGLLTEFTGYPKPEWQTMYWDEFFENQDRLGGQRPVRHCS